MAHKGNEMNDEFDYSYTVDAISDDARTAQVTYTPEDESLEPITKGVPVPLHKAADEERAKKIVAQKVRSYAPHDQWRRQLEARQPRRGVDIEAIKAAVTDRDEETGRPVPVQVRAERGE